MPSLPSSRTQAYLTLFALALVWGSSYILIKKSLLGFEAWQVGCLRITLAGLVFAPLAWRYCRGLSIQRWALLLAVGICGTGLPSFLFPLAQRALSSSLAAALSSLTPLTTTLIATFIFGLGLSTTRMIGMVIGLLGALLLVVARFGSPFFADVELPLGSIFLALAATLSYAISSNLVNQYLPKASILQVSSGAMAPLALFGIGGLLIGGGLPWPESTDELSSPIWTAYGSVALLGIFGTALANLLFYRLILITDAVFASTVSYLVPIIALFWGLLDGEVIGIGVMAALALILFGVYLCKR